MKDDMSMTITEFLEARIGEDEQAAAKAAQWVKSGPTPDVTWFGALGDGNIKQFGEGGNHVSTWSPARALAECEAKRAILEEHAPVHDENWISGKDHDYLWCSSCGTLDDAPVPFPCATLQALAAIYADHSDYQQEWAL